MVLCRHETADEDPTKNGDSKNENEERNQSPDTIKLLKEITENILCNFSVCKDFFNRKKTTITKLDSQ